VNFVAQDQRPDDGVLALEYLRGIVRGHDVAQEAAWFVVPGPPAAKERPREGRGHFYTPGTTRAAESALALYWRQAVRDRVLAGNVAVAAVFYVADERVKDSDNMLKLVLDAGNRAEVWPDDAHCTVHVAGLELDRARPRTVIAFCPTESTLVRRAPLRPVRSAPHAGLEGAVLLVRDGEQEGAMNAFVKALLAEVVRQGAVTFATTIASEAGTAVAERIRKRRKQSVRKIRRQKGRGRR
jgi:Holliday junction resolvase RusA-like endonuclease